MILIFKSNTELLKKKDDIDFKEKVLFTVLNKHLVENVTVVIRLLILFTKLGCNHFGECMFYPNDKFIIFSFVSSGQDFLISEFS